MNPKCGCNSTIRVAPLKENTPLVRLLHLEGRHQTATAFQAQWETFGNYDVPAID